MPALNEALRWLRQAEHDIATRYPDSLPGGIPAEAFDEWAAWRTLETAETIAAHVRERIGPR